MTQISAADNLVIDLAPAAWQLRSGDHPPMLYADAAGLRYNARFASSRRLPSAGLLTPPEILQVVLGWQRADETWHLGLVLTPELAASRGSRWCELVHWPDPDQKVFEDLALETGQRLAAVLQVPFRFIPPAPVAVTPPAPPLPLPALPLAAGFWSLEPLPALLAAHKIALPAQEGMVIFTRSARWQRQRLTKMLWYLLWVMVYAAVSVATLTSDLALPNAGTLLPDPHVLPYLGLVIAAGLIGMILYQMYLLRTEPDTIVFDPAGRSISGWRGDRCRWQTAAPDVQALYVSEVVRRKASDLTTEHGEMNLLLNSNRFAFVLQQQEAENQALRHTPAQPVERRKDNVSELTRASVMSDLQAMALYAAEALQIPCRYDMRVR
ncbi:MAG: hypothetical protein MUE40_03960 [Anaerolineae bacterium]|nr:hypothetical protein [Anaerolineae bacterium]